MSESACLRSTKTSSNIRINFWQVHPPHVMGFGLFFMGEYANIVIGSCLTTILFLGGWNAPLPFLSFIPGVFWFLLKLYLLIATFIWIRWTFPRTTIYGLLNLSWKILIPLSLFNLLFTAGLLKVF